MPNPTGPTERALQHHRLPSVPLSYQHYPRTDAQPHFRWLSQIRELPLLCLISLDKESLAMASECSLPSKRLLHYRLTPTPPNRSVTFAPDPSGRSDHVERYCLLTGILFRRTSYQYGKLCLISARSYSHTERTQE